MLPQFANFHDMLKARLLRLPQPVQIIRRSTWDETAPPPPGRSRQDEASRAWNLHTALYYKAGGVPWRLARNTADLTVCYIGVSFYRSGDGDVLDTSVAQVFNALGDGVIVRGGPARISGDDRQPHLLPRRRARPPAHRPGRLPARAPHPARPRRPAQDILLHQRRDRRLPGRGRRAVPRHP